MNERRILQTAASIAALSATLLAAACSEPDAGDAEPATASAVNDTATTDSVFAGDTQEHMLPAARIYHTLTDYEWYARGQPLLHDGRNYALAGAPVSAPLSEMRQAGDYQGVEFYVRDGDAAGSVLYVPVYRGYWQPFRATSSPAAGS